MNKDIDALVKDILNYEVGVEDHIYDLIKELQGELEEAVKFTKHKEDCAGYKTYPGTSVFMECDCGLDDFLNKYAASRQGVK